MSARALTKAHETETSRPTAKPVFRAGVGAVIADHDGRVLIFQRRDIPGAWQFPQGGIEGDEEPIDAAFREILEETGLTKTGRGRFNIGYCSA